MVLDKIEQFRMWVAGLGFFKGGLLILALGLLLFALIVFMRQPSHDRAWRAEIAVMPQATIEGTEVKIDHVRDWTYTSNEITRFAYHPATYDSSDIIGTWLMVEPFGGSDAIAHTLILFEFSDQRLLALTIEARKEEGEIYSAIKGAFNTYELIYLWAEARDVLTRRARYLKHDIFIYPIALSIEDRRAFFNALLDQTNTLYETPRFYNTLFSNCTNELAKTAGLKWNSAFITTGYAPEHLYKVGTITGKADGISFEALKSAADVTDLIKSTSDQDATEFGKDFLIGLKARFGGVQSAVSR